MPIGFSVPGYVLLLNKGQGPRGHQARYKQGSYLWFQKNKAAWNKCGLFADLVEPNLYTHKSLPIIAAVFADDALTDVGAGFAKRVTAEYLSIRAEYGKLIKIDCLGPETIVPLTKFTGVDTSRDITRQGRRHRHALDGNVYSKAAGSPQAGSRARYAHRQV
jgi:hypothetical protein